MPTRLVTFLGTGNYQPSTYLLDDVEHLSAYFQSAICKRYAPDGLDEICVLATKESQEKHASGLTNVIADVCSIRPRFIPIASGSNESELWSIFTQITQSLRGDSSGKIVFDITHGFRSIPFFAAGAIAFVNLTDDKPLPCRVLYGAWEARDTTTNISPVWDLSPFVDVIAWAARLLLFIKTGRADELAHATEQIGRDLIKQWAADRTGEKPTLDKLAKALREFGADLETIRVRDLLSGSAGPGSAKRLTDAATNCSADAAQHIPPLGELLGRIADLARPLISDSLAGESGQAGMLSLIKLYMDLQRYPEAAVVLRERAVSAHADQSASTPGASFDEKSRDAAERAWFQADPNSARAQADVRNDIEHGGFRKSPVNAHSLKQNLQKLVADINESTHSSPLN
jgi:CRISPR-associated protein Csx16